MCVNQGRVLKMTQPCSTNRQHFTMIEHRLNPTNSDVERIDVQVFNIILNIKVIENKY